MRKTRSCGVILFKEQPQREFLLMKHPHRLDLPKGHVDPGETDEQCALREMWEETGIPKDAVRIDPNFRFEEIYYPVEARFNNERVEKTLVIFLGWLDRDWPIVTTEHAGHEWRTWQPPHQLQEFTIDPLLAELERYFQTSAGGM
ncbi:MAG: NUDIX domain-containing protein [Planctomycetaceae bacterium]